MKQNELLRAAGRVVRRVGVGHDALDVMRQGGEPALLRLARHRGNRPLRNGIFELRQARPRRERLGSGVPRADQAQGWVIAQDIGTVAVFVGERHLEHAMQELLVARMPYALGVARIWEDLGERY